METPGDALLAGIGSETADLDVVALRAAVKETLDKLGPRERVLIVPPVRSHRDSVGCKWHPSHPTRALRRTSRGPTRRPAS
jgi:hypothetical protein